MISIIRIRFVAIMLGLCLLAGCGNDMAELRDYVAEVKARKSTDIEPIPEIKAYVPYSYLAQDRRDPFTPVTQIASRQPRSSSTLAPNFDRNLEPLEEFPLDSLRMAGTFRTKAASYALIKAPDSIVHRIQTGDHMGQNYGKVVAVEDSEVRLVEIVPDGLGGYMQRAAAIGISE